MALLGFVALTTSGAVAAAPTDTVDRDRLKRAAQLPSVGERYIWNFGISQDGRLLEGGQMPEELDPAPYRASLGDDDADAERWMDLAEAYRVRRADDAEKESLSRAVAILRRRKAVRTDDGSAMAALGLALAASGDDAGADEEVRGAEKAARFAWAGVAAEADLLVIRAASTTAGHRLATTSDVIHWIVSKPADVRGMDLAACDAARRLYERAVAAVAKEGVTGSAAASVFVRRVSLRHLVCAAEGDKSADAKEDENLGGAADRLQPAEPFAVLRIALDDAMSVPDAAGGRHVESWEKLSVAAQTRVTADLARLQELTESADAATAARAWQAIATVYWYCKRDPKQTEAFLRKAIATDPKVQQSWSALMNVLTTARRWDDLVTLCEQRLDVEPTARRRMMLASALVSAGEPDAAEKEWRTALQQDPDSAEANLGVAVLVLRRAHDDADVAEATTLVRATAALVAKSPPTNPWLGIQCDLADAVARGLAGDIDGSEKAARSVLAHWDQAPPAREVLAAIGR
jgi:tetratricopeptide (TPR) repeat protein